MKPKFTAQYVWHWMGDHPGAEIKEEDFEQLSGSMGHDREFERYSYAYTDDGNEAVPEAVLMTVLDGEEHAALLASLKPGDYIIVMAAGTLDYHTWTDWESGGTECDLEVDVEWHVVRVMTDEERRIHDDENGILPAGVPLALVSERSPWGWEWPKSKPPLFPSLFEMTPGQRALADRGVGSGIVAINGAVVESGLFAVVKDLVVEPPHSDAVIPGSLCVNNVPAGVAIPVVSNVLLRCAADRDGDCDHAQCPQIRDGEPKATGRSCPIACWEDDD